IEDFTILLALLHHFTGKYQTSRGELSRYSHILLDEAQEFSPLELTVTGHSLSERGSITIAGDALQQTDATSIFTSWDDLLNDLDLPQVDAQHLTTSYRSTKPIMDFAYKVLGP